LVEVSISLRAALVLGCNLTRFILEIYYAKFSKVINKVGMLPAFIPFQSAVGGIIGGFLTVVSIKFRRTPLLQTRLDFRQFWQFGRPSSHFKWRSLHVKQPVRTRFGLLADAAASAASVAPSVFICAGFFGICLVDLIGGAIRCRLDGGGLISLP
jgi:hypothetical protein